MGDPVAVRVADCPAQMAGELTDTVGDAFTVTVPDAVAEHPLFVYVTV